MNACRHIIKKVFFCGVVLCLCADRGVAPAQDIDACLACHADQSLSRTDGAGRALSLYVNKGAFASSVHGKSGYGCVDCHEGAEAKKHPSGGIADVSCGSCHEEAARQHESSRHGMLLKAENPYAPQCYDCHTMHAVLPGDDPRSSVHPDNLPGTCGACHEAEALPAGPLINTIKNKAASGLPGLFSLCSLLSARVKAHGKANPGADFGLQQCGSCHAGEIYHGSSNLRPGLCAGCHEGKGSSLLHGTVHPSGIWRSNFFSVLSGALYLVGIPGIIYVCRIGRTRKKRNLTPNSFIAKEQ